MVDSYRFEVAFSFAGDGKRDVVRAVAELLRDQLGHGKVFFDEWFEAELAGEDAQLVLQNIYRKEARLVVVCVCDRYDEKPWTQEEWRAIQSLERSLRDAGSDNAHRLRLLPLQFGDCTVDGLFDTAIVPRVKTRSNEDIARLILDRLRLATDRVAALSARPGGIPQAAQDAAARTVYSGQEVQDGSVLPELLPRHSLWKRRRVKQLMAIAGLLVLGGIVVAGRHAWWTYSDSAPSVSGTSDAPIGQPPKASVDPPIALVPSPITDPTCSVMVIDSQCRKSLLTPMITMLEAEHQVIDRPQHEQWMAQADRIAKEAPDIVVMHWHSLRSNCLDSSPDSDRQAEQSLLAGLKTIARRSPSSRFIFYSRSFVDSEIRRVEALDWTYHDAHGDIVGFFDRVRLISWSDRLTTVQQQAQLGELRDRVAALSRECSRRSGSPSPSDCSVSFDDRPLSCFESSGG